MYGRKPEVDCRCPMIYKFDGAFKQVKGPSAAFPELNPPNA
jgi:hypothetical protein